MYYHYLHPNVPKVCHGYGDKCSSTTRMCDPKGSNGDLSAGDKEEFDTTVSTCRYLLCRSILYVTYSMLIFIFIT